MVQGRFFSYDKRMQYRRGRDAAVFAIEIGRQGRAPCGR